MGSIVRRVAVALLIVVAAVSLWYRRFETPTPSRARYTEVRVIASEVIARPRDVTPTPGWHSVTLPFDEVTAMASLIIPGSRIDVLAVPHAAADERRRARVILENVRVVAVGDVRERNGRPIRARALTVEVESQADVERLIGAVRTSKLSYLLRGDEGRGAAIVSVGPTSFVPSIRPTPPCTNRRDSTLVYDAVLLSCMPQPETFLARPAHGGRDR